MIADIAASVAIRLLMIETHRAVVLLNNIPAMSL